ncbi:MAG: hypothetical protein ACFFAH_06530 [Promethearchaeota archaeon]
MIWTAKESLKREPYLERVYDKLFYVCDKICEFDLEIEILGQFLEIFQTRIL